MLKKYFERQEKVPVALVKKSERKVESSEGDREASYVQSEKEAWKESKR